mmetsp:Transcript_2578/g.3915  ORF Transcript_2578/g.3915 Transcript_2578/m.3915 type:complete len:97 (-) Transcript_2578:153-443(-)|eukprot:CAMPEP_0185019508 /NCGR_PEP_ID=MMETSP1103-20130426/2113_1 /TAXON_ID=36769 /ORGANISM="Paraphysomonas bandaiensis, Strain Caron Lab Isolate" /LENGTH=96 /DNA_ID=CAMNT_0027549853 /DNA_START=46 /DNA_END=336 /DNA_ORIENTATION=-
MERRMEFEKKLDSNVGRLLENYRTILQQAQIRQEVAPHDQLLLEAACANIVYSCESLLDQVHEIRMNVLLQDSPAILEEVKQEREKLEKRLAELSP